MNIRPAVATDQAYVASTWARSRLSHTYQRHMRSRAGVEVAEQINAVMDRDDSRCLVAARDADPHAIAGWVVYAVVPGVPVVHYLYTRRDDRGCGVAAALLERIGVTNRRCAVVCTSFGPSSESMRGLYKASVHMPLADFLR